jgi:hypothetical protein
MYDEQDVSKALLLKQLSTQGHAIGSIAHLALASLRQMTQGPQTDARLWAGPVAVLPMAVVGLAMANRIESKPFAAEMLHTLVKVTDVWADLETVQDAVLSGQPQVLLVKVNALQASVHTAVHALIQKHRFAQVIVTYHFATEAIVRLMKSSGMVVRREPISDSELAELIQSLLFVDPARAREFGTLGTVIAARKYSDETLNRVAGISTNVLCECPRHVAELIAQLVSLEEYSQECLNKNAEDAHLHAYLHSISGSARLLFENALEKIAMHEGIDLSEGNTDTA